MNKVMGLLLVAAIVTSLSGCGSGKTIIVNTNSEEVISGSTFGIDSLIKIGNGLWYDSATRVVYIWNGYFGASYGAAIPSPYYAPNGLPYKYNPETNMFEEINHDGI